MNLLIRIFKVVWNHYYVAERTVEDEQDGEDAQIYDVQTINEERKHEYMRLIRATVMLFDWLCLNNRFIFLFSEECGKTNIKFILDTCNKVLSQFRRCFENANKMGTMEDTTFNDYANKKVQS